MRDYHYIGASISLRQWYSPLPRCLSAPRVNLINFSFSCVDRGSILLHTGVETARIQDPKMVLYP